MTLNDSSEQLVSYLKRLSVLFLIAYFAQQNQDTREHKYDKITYRRYDTLLMRRRKKWKATSKKHLRIETASHQLEPLSSLCSSRFKWASDENKGSTAKYMHNTVSYLINKRFN